MSEQANPRVRQRFNVVIGWIGVVVGIALFAGSVASYHDGMLPFVGIALACVSYCLMARPWFSVLSEALVVSNVVREVTLPWEGISHATSRGTLVVHDHDGHRTTVWAIGSQKARSRSDATGDDPRMRFHWRPSPGSLVSPVTSASALREAIDAEVIDNPPGPSGRTVRWLPIPCLLMTVAVLAVLLGFLL